MEFVKVNGIKSAIMSEAELSLLMSERARAQDTAITNMRLAADLQAENKSLKAQVARRDAMGKALLRIIADDLDYIEKQHALLEEVDVIMSRLQTMLEEVEKGEDEIVEPVHDEPSPVTNTEVKEPTFEELLEETGMPENFKEAARKFRALFTEDETEVPEVEVKEKRGCTYDVCETCSRIPKGQNRDDCYRGYLMATDLLGQLGIVLSKTK